MAKKKLTFTHPTTGNVYTRTTDPEYHDYQFISIKEGKDRWHETREAAMRTRGQVFALPSQQEESGSKPMSGEFPTPPGATCTIPSGASGGKCGQPAVFSFRGRDGSEYHECYAHSRNAGNVTV